jgi:hypothetical protein
MPEVRRLLSAVGERVPALQAEDEEGSRPRMVHATNPVHHLRRQQVTTPAERAVIDAANEYAHQAGLRDGTGSIVRAVRALDACTEPDLDALDHAVAEAVEAYREYSPNVFGVVPATPEARSRWGSVVSALEARRAALAPKPRYEACPEKHVVMWDRQTREYLNPLQVAALLNEREPKP